MEEVIKLINDFKHLVNQQLPSTYTEPVQLNHCFNRIILDWLYKDCWYNHLDKNKTALSQLDEEQLKLSVQRMKTWLSNQQILIEDNMASLRYRKNHHQ